MIDFASDTVTKPTAAMLAAMSSAEVGDDVYREDPTVNALETKAAELFGTEAALFCASGTMTNQIAISVHTRPGDEVICHRFAHIFGYEGGGIMANAGASVRLVGDPNGMMTAEQVSAAINSDDIHRPRSRMVAIENTSNMGGGSCFRLADLEPIATVARDKGLAFHLDGARLFNALVATGDSPAGYGTMFDSISICLSKGLGCPVGSLVLGDTAFIDDARRVRKRFGGGWRQAGFLAAAGIHALDHHIDRLADDHARAAALGASLAEQVYVASVNPVETNIVIFQLQDPSRVGGFLRVLRAAGVRATDMGDGLIRMVTHLDIDDDDIDQMAKLLPTLDF